MHPNLKKAFKEVLKELNPLRDMEGITSINHYDLYDPAEIWDAVKHNARNIILPLPKHLGRGAILGGLGGVFMSAVSNQPIAECLKSGAAMGTVIDGSQYLIRSWLQYISQCRPD